MGQHHRVVVHVDDPAVRIDRVDEAATGLRAGQAGADVEELPDAGLADEESDRALVKGEDKGHDRRDGGRDREHGLRRPAIGFKVIPAATEEIRYPGRVGHGGINQLGPRPGIVELPVFNHISPRMQLCSDAAATSMVRGWYHPLIPQGTMETVTPIRVSCAHGKSLRVKTDDFRCRGPGRTATSRAPPPPVPRTPQSVSARTASGSAPASVMSSLTSATSQIRANATLPILELSATTTTRRAQPIMTAFVCASTS